VGKRRTSQAILAALCVAFLAGCVPQASPLTKQPAKTVSHEIPDTRAAQSDAVLDNVTQPTAPGCSAAVAVDGAVVWAGAHGLANLATGEQLTTGSRFDMASVSKQFTATAILMLQRQGLLSLSDPIGRYLNGLPAWGKTITLDQIMHHTSHIPDYWRKLGEWGFGFSTPATQADAVRAIAAVSKLEKGTGYLYSNSNYVLLAEVVRRVSGKPLPDFLDQRIFKPLGLNMVLDPNLQAPDVAVSYDDNNQPTRSGWAFYGPVGIFSNPTELARWANQYRDGSVVFDDFAVGAVDSGTPGEATEGRVYAAGIDIEADGALRHDGRVGGYISTLKISPDRETAVAVMCNGHLADRFGLLDGLWAVWVTPPRE
jgi:CubicO group peptidase (beta-lactamase class C family)